MASKEPDGYRTHWGDFGVVAIAAIIAIAGILLWFTHFTVTVPASSAVKPTGQAAPEVSVFIAPKK